MQNLSDEDLDKLFKRAAEQQQTQFDPADWDNMASRLDASKKPWLNYYTGTGSMVLLGVVIWLGWLINKPGKVQIAENVSTNFQNEVAVSNNQSAEDLNVISRESSALYPSTQKVEGRIGKQANLAENALSNKLTKAKVGEDQNFSKVKHEEKSFTGKPNSVAGVKKDKQSSPISATFSNQDQNELILEPSVSRGEDHSKNSNIKSNASEVVIAGSSTHASNIESSANLDSQLKSDTDELSIQSSNKSVRDGQMLAADSVNKIVSQNEEEVTKRQELTNSQDSVKKKPTFSRFGIKATVAPDFSSEQFKSFDKMGFNYGLVAEYFLTKNLSIATGALWSRKYYSAENVDYNGYHADRAYGDCRMWDIPLNVNYYFTPSSRYSFFASAGLSSYLMNEENYEYEVDTNYGPKTYTSQVIKENNEWFKTLNVSVGLQRQISSRFTIQVEPFVKVPLAGVGEGNISLASFGGFFSVRYNFLTIHK